MIHDWYNYFRILVLKTKEPLEKAIRTRQEPTSNASNIKIPGFLFCGCYNFLSHKIDKHPISPYSTITCSNIQVMRIKEVIS